jgi:uncharacterized damage-inducible protein DinB
MTGGPEVEAIDGNCHALEQGVQALREIDDLTYQAAGPHFRHVLDHYHSFLAGLPDGRVDYDARRRDPRLEQDRSLAIATALGTAADLRRLPSDLGSHALQVSVLSVADGEQDTDWSESTVKRELQFLVSHTVHHYALIREILRRHGADPGEAFGMAPSTAAYRRQQAACAP